MELLLLFIEHRGQLVTRDEIIEKIWSRDVFLDTDNSINGAIRKIRQALRDDPDSPRFLQTVIGKGYRFVGTVEELTQAQPSTTSTNGVQAGKVTAAGAQPAVAPLAHFGDRNTTRETTISADKEAARGIRLADRDHELSLARQPRPLIRWRLVWASGALILLVLGLIAWPVWRHYTAARESGKLMLVVLPFNNLSGDPSQDYFADGMTEEMITQLGGLNPERLGVVARVSAMHYRHTDKSASQISRELGVNYLLEGSIRRSGSRIRVTAQLIQASDQTQLWAVDYDREISDSLQLQSEIAQAIAKQIQVALSEQTKARLAAKPKVDPEAYEEYLQGLQELTLRSSEGFRAAIQHFERATSIDPKYALAYAAQARCYGLLPIFGDMKPAEAMPKARDAAERALQLDDSLAEAHTALGFVKAHYEYDWPGAEREFRRGIELNPSDPMAHMFYSNSYLSPRGRHYEAIAEMKNAISLDPYSIMVQAFLIRTYTWAHRWDDAEAQFQKVNAMNPNFAVDHSRMSRLAAYSGRYELAIEEDIKARVLSGESPDEVISRANRVRKALAQQGAKGYWTSLLEFTHEKENPAEGYDTAFGIAILYAQVGDKDKAFEWLNRAYQERDVLLTELAIEPGLEQLHADRRFREFVQRVGLQ